MIFGKGMFSERHEIEKFVIGRWRGIIFVVCFWCLLFAVTNIPFAQEGPKQDEASDNSFSNVIIYPGPFFYNIVEIRDVTAEFSFPVTGIDPQDLTVNGSSAKEVSKRTNEDGKEFYIFTGFANPAYGKVEIELKSDDIRDIKRGRMFTGAKELRFLFDAPKDDDSDGLNNEHEIQIHTDPLKADTDGDGRPDPYEAKNRACLSPINNEEAEQNNYGFITPGDNDLDNDGVSNVEEYRQGTDPCH